MRTFAPSALALICVLTACSPATRVPDPHRGDMTPASGDLSEVLVGDMSSPSHPPIPMDDMSTGICSNGACFTVYAHTDTGLYTVDLDNKTLFYIGPFKAPVVPVVRGGKTYMDPDVITDLAVTPENVIYVVSKSSALYTASATDGHVTLLGQVKNGCGTEVVALTFTPDGNLYGGDYSGPFCKIDLHQTPPVATTIGKLDNKFALAGDIVAVGDGTMYGTATVTGDSKSAANNWLIKIDPATAKTTAIGQTGYGNMFGLGYAEGKVFGFTHNCSGDVVTIDPKTGVGTPYNVFTDTMNKCQTKGNTGTGVSFAGAGVNATVNPSPGPVT